MKGTSYRNHVMLGGLKLFPLMSGPWNRSPSKTRLTLDSALILIDNVHTWCRTELCSKWKRLPVRECIIIISNIHCAVLYTLLNLVPYLCTSVPRIRLPLNSQKRTFSRIYSPASVSITKLSEYIPTWLWIWALLLFVWFFVYKIETVEMFLCAATPQSNTLW